MRLRMIGAAVAAVALAGCRGAQLSAGQRRILRAAGVAVPASSVPANSCRGGHALAAREQRASWPWQPNTFSVACSNGTVALVSQGPTPPTASQMSQLSQLLQDGCIAGWQRDQGAQDATDASQVIAAAQQSGCQ